MEEGEDQVFPTKRSALCLGVKAFFSLPSPKSFLYPVIERVGLHAHCHHTRAKIKETDADEEQPSADSRVVGRFQELKQLDAQVYDLCEYIDIVKGKHSRLLAVSEHYRSNLAKEIDNYKRNGLVFEESVIRRWAFRIMRSLAYLNSKGIVHRALCPSCLLLDGERDVKVADYGMYYMTECGKNCNFAIGSPAYLAPETLAAGPCSVSSPQTDVWSLGVILLELVSLEKVFQSQIKDSNLIFHEATTFWGHKLEYTTEEKAGSVSGSIKPPPFTFHRADDESEKTQLLRRHDSRLADLLHQAPFDKISSGLRSLIQECLVVMPSLRKTPTQLLQHPYFVEEQNVLAQSVIWVPQFLLQTGFFLDEESSVDHSETDEESDTPQRSTKKKLDRSSTKKKRKRRKKKKDPLEGKPLSEIFHFWKLAGGDLESELQLSLPPAILRMPMVVRTRPQLSSPLIHPSPGASTWKEPCLIYDERILSIPLTALRERLHMNHKRSLDSIFLHWEREEVKQQRLPPLDLREKDVDYQRYRVKIFRDLMKDFPKARKQVLRQAHLDIPPVLRGEVWATILDVSDSSVDSIYESYDKESEGPSDHQIDLDIPRCHQYNELLHSPEGHRKLRRVLKCWVAANPDLVYWQGLDSLLAPFIVHNFSNEAKAFCCMQNLVKKYLRNFFGKDNALYLQEHLMLFRQLLSYTDPQLAFHIHNVGFNPELFAIPWFLTLFTHVFPLAKIYHLWDTLLLRPPSLPLFVAVSLMKYLREKLLQLDFNSCLIFVSNLPEIEIEEVLRDSLATFDIVATSLTQHKWKKLTLEDGDSRWWEVRVPLEDMRNELSPRISIGDLLEMKHPTIILDIRSRTSFEKEKFANAIHLDSTDTQFNSIQQYRLKKHFVVVSDDHKAAVDIANQLVERHFPFVSVLNGGMDAVRADASSKLVRGGP